MKNVKFRRPAPLPLCGFAISAIALATIALLESNPAAPNQPGGRGLDLALTSRVEDFAAQADRATAEIAVVFRNLAKPVDKPGKKYEDAALASVEELLAKSQVPQRAKLLAAQTILVGVLRWHKLNRNATPADSEILTDLEIRLNKKLYAARRDLLTHAADSADNEDAWKTVFAFADRLRKVYPRDRLLPAMTGRFRLRQAEAFLAAKQFPQALLAWKNAMRWLPLDPQTKKTEGDLRQEADRRYKQGRALKGNAVAIPMLQNALHIYPWLPGLRDDLLKRQGKYRVLWVAVRQLPENLSPATAFTDVEKQTLDLLFEPLLRSEYNSRGGQQYQTALAAKLPDPSSSGRSFFLSPEARWSDGRRITSFDVQHNIELMKRAGGDDRIVWSEQIQTPRPVQPFQLDFRMRRPLRAPLRLFTFPVLPRSFRGKPLTAADDKEFAKAPLGSGPYRYVGKRLFGKYPVSQFSANPFFVRSDRPQQPFLREIRMAVPDGRSPKVPGHDKEFQFWLNLTEEQVGWLKTHGKFNMRTLPERRVSFLAINHRRPLLQKTDLRRALAAAIDRKAVLDRCFRGKDTAYKLLETLGAGVAATAGFTNKLRDQSHRPLNGLFPPGSWAIAPQSRVPSRLYDMAKARAFFRRALQKSEKATLTLKHHNADPRLRSACLTLAQQINKAAEDANVDLTITTMALSPQQFRLDLQNRDYDLAVSEWDFDPDFYRIWPLFDPAGNSNILAYTNDAVLVSMLRKRMTTSDFSRVRELSHDIHSHLYEKMPLIPLWQLDRHIAINSELQIDEMAPTHVFGQIAEWSLK